MREISAKSPERKPHKGLIHKSFRCPGAHFLDAQKYTLILFYFISRVPEHYSSQSNGPFPVFQRGFSCQVHKLLWTDQLLIKLQEKRPQ